MYNYTADIGIRNDILEHLSYLEELASTKSFILELGCQYGNGSTLALMNGLKSSHAVKKLMISVDIDDQLSPERKPIEEYWHFILGNSSAQRVYDDARVLMGDNKFDLVFIDSYHAAYHAKDEMNLWSPLFDDKAVILFHDIWDDLSNKETSLSTGLKEVSANLGYSFETFSQLGHGLAKLVKI